MPCATSSIPCPIKGKEPERVGPVDDLLVGRANIIHERDEHDLNTGRYR